MNSEEIKAEYTNSLSDLTFNSKPLINMLTMLADENSSHANIIVSAIEEHLTKVHTDIKLPILYLIDCIAKNIGGVYTQLFSQNIVTSFCSVFKLVDEKTRSEMFKLRQTWNDIFPQKKLYAIDVQIHMLDPAWPVTAQPPPNSIHLNPKFLKNKPKIHTNIHLNKAEVSGNDTFSSTTKVVKTLPSQSIDTETITMQHKLIEKQKELIELQQKKLELELLQTQVKLQKQITGGQDNKISDSSKPNILLKPEVASQIGVNSSSVVETKNCKFKENQVLVEKNSQCSTVLSTYKSQSRDPRLLRQQQHMPILPASNQATPLHKTMDTYDGSDHEEKLQLIVKSSCSTNNVIEIDSNKVASSINSSSSSSVLDNHDSSNQTIHRISISTEDSDKPNKFSESPHRSSRRKRKSRFSARDDELKLVQLDSEKIVPKLCDPATSNIVDFNSSFVSPSQSISKETMYQTPIIISSSCEPSNLNSPFRPTRKNLKSRNYIRRNRSPTLRVAAESKDVDLREQPSIRNSSPPMITADNKLCDDLSTECNSDASIPTVLESHQATAAGITAEDVDFRTLSLSNKKRLPAEMEASNPSKKSKSEIFDVLFGNEDTDLRLLPTTAENPPTPPPPPIISNPGFDEHSLVLSTSDNVTDCGLKLSHKTDKDSDAEKSCLDQRKQAHSLIQKMDEDLRILEPKRGKFIVSSDEIMGMRSGHMSEEQKNFLVSKIIRQMELQKLLEAQLNERVGITNNKPLPESSDVNISLQPVSDVELELDKSGKDISLNSDTSVSGGGVDRDERFAHNSSGSPIANMNSRRLNQFWRSGNRRKLWDDKSLARIHNRPRRYPWHHTVTEKLPVHLSTSTHLDSDNCGSEVICQQQQDDIRTINIDGVPREIRVYNRTAVVFMMWDDPREISFQDGGRRAVFNGNISVYLEFNEPDSTSPKEVTIDGIVHTVRLGVPTQEIIIDAKPFECYFGSPPIGVDLRAHNGECHRVNLQLEGPPPQVKIGKSKRTDLVAGKVQLIIDARISVSVYLDAKPQRFRIDNELFCLKFVDAFNSCFIDDVPLDVEFGGLPKPVIIGNRKHFIRFSVLPRGIRQGFVRIKNMSVWKLSPTRFESQAPEIEQYCEYNKDLELDQNPRSPRSIHSANLDVLSNVLASSTPTRPGSASIGAGYQVQFTSEKGSTIAESSDELVAKDISNDSTHVRSYDALLPPPPPPVPPLHLLPPSINIDDLFQKLVATGIVATEKSETSIDSGTGCSDNDGDVNITKTSDKIKPKAINIQTDATSNKTKNDLLSKVTETVTFYKMDTLRRRHAAFYDTLYAGVQCSSCGMRFHSDETTIYSQHLDWHFRQNRKGKRNIRVAANRKWYYKLEDWKNYEEIEDLGQREKIFFDQQQVSELNTVASTTSGVELDKEDDDNRDSIGVPADSTMPMCDVCREMFDQYFNEEKEEWHLKNAIRVDDKAYHPICYQDYQLSVSKNVELDLTNNPVEQLDEHADEKLIPGLEIILDDDEDDIKADDITEVILDESSGSREDSPKEKFDSLSRECKKIKDNDISLGNKINTSHILDEDDVVLINEIVPERIVVNDDEDDEYENKYISRNLNEPLDSDSKNDYTKPPNLDSEIKYDSTIVIKTEPVDSDDLMDDEAVSIDEEEKPSHTTVCFNNPLSKSPTSTVNESSLVTSHISSIDGNNVIQATPMNAVITNRNASNIIGSKIKINISKILPLPQALKEPDIPIILGAQPDLNNDNNKICEDSPFDSVTIPPALVDENVLGILDCSQPPPPGEETIQLHVKPRLVGLKLKSSPRISKGIELTGMCSVM